MTAKFAWAITGAGDYLPESVEAIREVLKATDYKVMIFMSKAGEKVVHWYKLMEEIKTFTTKVKTEIDANTPFIPGVLQRRKYDFLVVMPATANTVAKIVHGIADTLVTNSVSQAQKTEVPIIIYPVDQKPGTITTVLPSGETLTLTNREVDLENVRKLRKMKGMTVLGHPKELLSAIGQLRKEKD